MGSISEKFEAFPKVPLGPRDGMWDLQQRIIADTSPDKFVLGAGVYRDENGKYYELPVIRKAKEIVASQPADHDYGGFATGHPGFLKGAQEVLFGKGSEVLKEGRVASAQTIAGSGACHIGALFASKFFAAPGVPSTAYVGAPAWGNYDNIFPHAGLPLQHYPYYDASTKSVAFATLLDTIRAAPPRSVFVLQAVCHNPTGMDLSKDQWLQVADALEAGRHLPFFDIAYQGFGTGLEEDAWAVREFVRRGLEVIVAQSFSKNLGLYGERIGAVHVVVGDAAKTVNVVDQLRCLVRFEHSSAPRYPATWARIVMEEFWDEWLDNLKEMRERVHWVRKTLHKLLTEELKTPGYWDNIIQEQGLFSILSLTPTQVERIGTEFHIHFLLNGRINVAGLNENNVGKLAKAIDVVVREG
ncbi:aspartate aminotransferase [Macrophomina phaseolina]|uniref:Aspartate aminotransferase n=1 Tax=Macrophomina phaseolina TaxID=35725 RepID=A0ABQ8GVU2_9PEZI|nr:aspartate aminotransferase [Macrophomina phaseolina]